MIRVLRHLPPPPILVGPRADEARKLAAEHFDAEDAASAQAAFKFAPLYRDPDVRRALTQVFANKCAFCESPVGASAAPIAHHFRPKQDAVGLDGSVSRTHYWWLAYDWENLYLSCQRCATAAGARFPVKSTRAPTGAVEPQLEAEGRLLIDPCRDEPSEHLLFDDQGVAAARGERGEPTIDTYKLNRADLVEARRLAVADALRTARARIHAGEPDVESLLEARRPYAAAVRQAVGRLFEAEGIPLHIPEFVTTAETVEAVKRERARRVEALSIERIEIRDFRAIEHLELELAAPGTAETPWTMLLGENGYGKSSVLQAIALTLMGEKARDRLAVRPDSLIRHEAELAEITIQIRGAIEPRRLLIDRRSGRFEVRGDDPPTALAAYGAGRIPAVRERRKLPTAKASRPRVESLFDPSAVLVPATRWLLSLDDEHTFNYAARALRALTLEPETTVFEPRNDTVDLLRPGAPPISLDELSDGYRAMIALAADLMSFFVTRYGSMEAAEGIVLVDELGAHLHPTWQMRIVRAFQEAFPRLQFVATTHDPLCLRGMERGIVVVLRRTDQERIYSLPQDEVPSVRGLQVDELLLGGVRPELDDRPGPRQDLRPLLRPVGVRRSRRAGDRAAQGRARQPSPARRDGARADGARGGRRVPGPGAQRRGPREAPRVPRGHEGEAARDLGGRAAGRIGVGKMRKHDIPACPVALGPGSKGEQERKDAIDHFTSDDFKAGRPVKTFKFEAYSHPDVKATLNAAFKTTCAYCESAYAATQPVAIEHYRPKGEVWREDGKPRKPGYFWLASTWTNLLPSCTRCNTAEWQDQEDGTNSKSGKGNWFPLRGGEAQRATAPDKEIDEEPLLLHPYSDEPSEHLEFVDEGVVKPRADAAGIPSDKGDATIKVLGLNRRDLADLRRRRRVVVDAHLKRIAEYGEDIADNPGVARYVERRDREIAQLNGLTELGEPYSGMVLQLVRDASI